jgi:hypothetical protein
LYTQQQDVFVGGHEYVCLTLSENSVDGGLRSCEISFGGDPESPLCARLVLSGSFLNISGTDEEEFAALALFSRHPQMISWPVDHSWFFGKVVIKNIYLFLLLHVVVVVMFSI